MPLTVLAARDGEEAMALLRTVAMPDLGLLDPNLPRTGGLDVLADLAADPELHRIPVMVLPSSAGHKDVQRARDRNANAYLVKSLDLDEFAAAVATLRRCWLGVVRLPSQPDAIG